MRLTLRTLLAYLNDSLNAAETRWIGQKVVESERSQKLMRRIQKVTRRRRLTAPDSEPGAASIDANDVAEYLDNVLAEDKVAEVERICLEEDVNLAEVAGAHQILSRVLGEPALITPETRRRIYAAVGIKASAPTAVTPVGPSPTDALAAVSRSGEMAVSSSTIPAFPAGRTPGARFGTAVLVLVLVAALGFATLQALKPTWWAGNITPLADAIAAREWEAMPEKMTEKQRVDGAETAISPSDAAKVAVKVVVKDASAIGKAPLPPPKTTVAMATGAKPVVPNPVATSPAPTPQPVAENAKPDAPRPGPASIQATYSSTSGVLIRLKPTGPERLQTATPVNLGDVLVNLDGSRSVLTLPDKPAIDMVDQTRLQMGQSQNIAIRLFTGRLVVRSVARPASFLFVVGKTPLRLDAVEPNSLVAMHVLPPAPGPGLPALLVGAIRGKLQLNDGQRGLALDAGWEVEVSGAAGLGTPHAENPPPWLGASTLAPADQKIADRIAGKDGMPFGAQGVALSLQQRIGDRNREVRRYAVKALSAIDAFPSAIDAMGDARFNDNRQTAVAALRFVVRQDVVRAGQIEAALLGSFPMADARWMMEMLYGYPPQAAGDAAVRGRLIASLDSESPAIRELAITNLKELYGKDNGFNAGDNAGRRAASVRAWRASLGDK